MSLSEIDSFDIEVCWLTQVEQGAEEVIAVRSLANRLSSGDIEIKKAIIKGYVAHLLLSEEKLQDSNYKYKDQLTLFESID